MQQFHSLCDVKEGMNWNVGTTHMDLYQLAPLTVIFSLCITRQSNWKYKAIPQPPSSHGEAGQPRSPLSVTMATPGRIGGNADRLDKPWDAIPNNLKNLGNRGLSRHF